MSDLITELCQLTAEILQDNPHEDLARLVGLVKQGIDANSRLGEAIQSDRLLTQINQDGSKGFQTWVAGGVANIGNTYLNDVQPKMLQKVLQRVLADVLKSQPQVKQTAFENVDLTANMETGNITQIVVNGVDYEILSRLLKENHLSDNEQYYGLTKLEKVAAHAVNWIEANVQKRVKEAYHSSKFNGWQFEYIEEIQHGMYGVVFESDFSIDEDDLPEELLIKNSDIGESDPRCGRYYWRQQLIMNENGDVREVIELRNTCTVPKGIKPLSIEEEIEVCWESILRNARQHSEQAYQDSQFELEGMGRDCQTLLGSIDSTIDKNIDEMEKLVEDNVKKVKGFFEELFE